MPRLPTPLGTFLYPRFLRLPWADRARCGVRWMMMKVCDVYIRMAMASLTPLVFLVVSSCTPTPTPTRSAFKLLSVLLDFDNSDEAWKRYDKMTAREL